MASSSNIPIASASSSSQTSSITTSEPLKTPTDTKKTQEIAKKTLPQNCDNSSRVDNHDPFVPFNWKYYNRFERDTPSDPFSGPDCNLVKKYESGFYY